MSRTMRYVILIIIFIGLLSLFIFAPKVTGIIINSGNNFLTNNGHNEEYYDCIKYCEQNANKAYGKEYYGTVKWNNLYNDCWNKHCQKYSN